MKRWRKRSQVGDSEPAVLTPAHVQVLRDRQDARGVHLVKMFLLVCLVGAGADAALFGSIDAQEYKLILGITILGAVLFAFAYYLVRDGRELHGVVLALVVSSVHILFLCSQISAAVSVESILFPIALAPFVIIRRDLPALRLALASFAIVVYVVCELVFPEGSAPRPLVGNVAEAFARGNRVTAAISLLVLLVILQRNMSTTRRILEGAARYGEVRATTDELTGVFNRRPIIAQLSEWAERGRGNYAIALIDLDHFKTINDEYGHNCGDTVLQTVALTLRSHFRNSDMVSRWGGDEFLVLMPGVRHFDLVPMLQRLRRTITLIEERCGDHVHHVTVSIGASMGAIGQTSDECIAAADHALYRAKAEGRDKVIAVGVSRATQAQGRPPADDTFAPPSGPVHRQ
ncbi:GGDEF domain-containing protein [Demequina sp.]|uniref:GGDEF domain-containing protein n=1 Tax=Demequina sp. TaxID=2050685 RepID=UPI0025C50A9B|nr:GGDEF domain-containing protein [Demequina sp.]